MINIYYQKLEPGNAVRVFDEIDGSVFGLTDILRFPILRLKSWRPAAMNQSCRLSQSGGRTKNTKRGRARLREWKHQPAATGHSLSFPSPTWTSR